MKQFLVQKRINLVLFAVYLYFVLFSQVFVSEHISITYITLSALLLLGFVSIISPVVLYKTSELHLNKQHRILNTVSFPLTVLFFAVPFLVFFIYYIAYYPGGFAYDSITQYGQAVSNKYDDWHPALHTLFAFKLPLTLTGEWIGSIVLFQIILFSASLGYCFYAIYKYTSKKYTVISMIFILFNPLTSNFAMYPLKDVSFAIGTITLITFTLHIYMTKGLWLHNPWHVIIFIIIFVMTTLCRHNALLFTFPLLFAVLIMVSPVFIPILLCGIIGLTATIKGPVYSYFEVEKPGLRQSEMLGLPMTIIGSAVKYNPEVLDDDVLEFANKVAPLEMWDTFITPGDYNSLKFADESDEQVIENYGAAQVIRLMIKCFLQTPLICLNSLVKLTEGIYTITDPHPIDVLVMIAPNNYEILNPPQLSSFCFKKLQFLYQ